jgi:hypothetical protein
VDCGRGGGADGIGHIKTCEATVSIGQPDGRTSYAGICSTKGLGDIDFFLLEKGELTEKKFLVFGFACDALAWGVVDIGDFFEG